MELIRLITFNVLNLAGFQMEKFQVAIKPGA